MPEGEPKPAYLVLLSKIALNSLEGLRKEEKKEEESITQSSAGKNTRLDSGLVTACRKGAAE